MTRNLASTLTLAGTAAIAVTLLLTVAHNAQAEDITIDATPFVSSRTRAEVRAEVMNVYGRTGPTEWTMQQSAPSVASSRAATIDEVRQARAERRAQTIEARRQTSEMNSEDSGSSYLRSLQLKRQAVNR